MTLTINCILAMLIRIIQIIFLIIWLLAELGNYKSIQFFITLKHTAAIIDHLPHACYTKKSDIKYFKQKSDGKSAWIRLLFTENGKY